MKSSTHRLSLRLIVSAMLFACVSVSDAQELKAPSRSRLFSTTNGFSESTIRITTPNKATPAKEPQTLALEETELKPIRQAAKPVKRESPVTRRSTADESNKVSDEPREAFRGSPESKRDTARKSAPARKTSKQTPEQVDSQPTAYRSSSRSLPTTVAAPSTQGRHNRSANFETRIGSYALQSSPSKQAARTASSNPYATPVQNTLPLSSRVINRSVVSDLTAPSVPADFGPTAYTESGNASEFVYDDGFPSDCDDGSCLGWCPLSMYQGGSWFVGAEYVYVRPRFSEAAAYLQVDVDAGGNRTNSYTNYEFGHNGAYRAFLGYQMCDCGGEVLFTYTDFEGDAYAQSGPADFVGATPVIIVGHLDVNPGQGEHLQTRATVGLNTYDLEFAKSMSYDGPTGPCDDGCCSCPRWDIRWSAGLRIADVNWGVVSQSVTAGGAVQETGQIEMDFSGAGPRLGLEGRRYGRSGRWLLFAKGNVSLLLGDYQVRRATLAATTTTETLSNTRMIPVTEIEVGGTFRANQRMAFTAGYLFHAWHDLGMTDNIPGELGSNDDANILAFDGLFIRGEWSF